MKPAITTTQNNNSSGEKGRMERHWQQGNTSSNPSPGGAAGSAASTANTMSVAGIGGPVSGSTGTGFPSASGGKNSMSTGCVRWCVNVALQSFAGEPWAVGLGPLTGDGLPANASFSLPGSSLTGPSANTVGGSGGAGASTTRNKGVASESALPRIQTTTAASRAEKERSHNTHNSSSKGSATGRGGGGNSEGRDGTDAGSGETGEGGNGDVDVPRGSHDHNHSAGSTTSATHAVFGSKYGTETTSAQRCGMHMYVVDWDQDEIAAAVSALEGGGSSSGTASPPQFYGLQPEERQKLQEELQKLQQCVSEVNDPPVTYGHDELLNRITNVEFLPTVVERTDPESGYVDSQMHYHLRSSLEPLLNASVKPAITATVDHCISSVVLVYGATQEMKQMGLIGTPEECGLLPHAIRLFMERHAERKEEQLIRKQQKKSSGSAAGGKSASEDRDVPSPESRPGSTTGSSSGNMFVFPQIGSKRHNFVRVEATFIAFDSNSVVDLINLDNPHVELVLQLAPPPTPSAFEDASNEDMPRSSSTPTTDSFVLHARAMPAETTNDALSALDIGLENLSRALEKAALQSESGSSLLFTLTAYTENGRCASMHVLCLAEDPAAQTWLASTVGARSQAIPLGEEQSWASIQNTPMPPPLHHHAATLLVPALCFGNVFTSILICVYNSMAALTRLSRDLTLAVTGYRMRTIPRVSLASSRRGGKVPLPAGWEENFTEDGRRYFTETSSRATMWEDPRFVARPINAGGVSGTGGVNGQGGSGGVGSGEGAKDGGPREPAGGGSWRGSGTGGNAGASGSSTSAIHRGSRIGLGEGDCDFLASKLHQPDGSITSPLGSLTSTTPHGAASTAEPLDVGIVVVDASYRPRVVLGSSNVNFSQQLAEEERALAAEMQRVAATKAARERKVQERDARRQRREAERQRREEEELEKERQRAARRLQHKTEKEHASSTSKSTKSASTAMASTTTGAPVAADQGSVKTSTPSGSTGNGSNASTVVNPLTSTDRGSCTTPLAATPADSHRPEDGDKAHALEPPANGKAAAAGHTGPPQLPGAEGASLHAVPDLELSLEETRAREALASTSFDSDEDDYSTRDSSESSQDTTQEGDARYTIAEAGDGDEDEEDSESTGGLIRSAASTCDDFEFDAAEGDDVPASAKDPVTKALNTARFYANAMKEQVVTVGDISGTSGGGKASGTGAAGASAGASGAASAVTSASASVVGTPAAPGAPAMPDGSGPSPLTLTPEMQDLESLVEEFTAFFKRAYESEQRVKELETELEDLRMINGSRTDLFSASMSSPSMGAIGSSSGGFGVHTGGRSLSSGGGGGEGTSPPGLHHDHHADSVSAERRRNDSLGGGAAALPEASNTNSLTGDAKRKLLRRIDDVLAKHATPSLRARLAPCFARVTRAEKASKQRGGLVRRGEDGTHDQAASGSTGHITHSSPGLKDASLPDSLGAGKAASVASSGAPLLTPQRTFRRGVNLANFFLEVLETTLKQYKDVEGQLRATHRTHYSYRVSQLCEDSRALVRGWGTAYEDEVTRLRAENARLRAKLANDGEAAEAPGLASRALPSLTSLLAQHRELFQDALPESDENMESDNDMTEE